jgi:hypothetical protein
MAINVTCPACGSKRVLSEAFRGLSLACPKCGQRSTSGGADSSASRDVLPSLSDEGVPTLESSFETATIAPSPVTAIADTLPPLLKMPEPPSRPEQQSRSSADHLLPRLPELPPSPEHQPRSSADHRSVPGDSSASTKAAGRREYKVLTRKNLWFSGEFSPEGLQEALNTYAQQGWSLKSTMVLSIPGPEGSRDELIVIMER